MRETMYFFIVVITSIHYYKLAGADISKRPQECSYGPKPYPQTHKALLRSEAARYL
jgi:hypothetical protein